MTELSLSILDIATNSQAAGATIIEIDISIDTTCDRLAIKIKDNGRGISDKDIIKATDPFFTTRTTRKVGMGLPLFKMLCEQCEGSFAINNLSSINGSDKRDNSAENKFGKNDKIDNCLKSDSDSDKDGNCPKSDSKMDKGVSGVLVEAALRLNSVDRPPLGDMGATVTALIHGYSAIRYIFRYSSDGSQYVFDTDEIKAIIGDDITSNEILMYCSEMINENIESINGGLTI